MWVFAPVQNAPSIVPLAYGTPDCGPLSYGIYLAGAALMEERLLTIEDVAKYLGVNKFTVYRLVTKKKIPGFKVGNQWRFKKDMIVSWLEGTSNLRNKPRGH